MIMHSVECYINIILSCQRQQFVFVEIDDYYNNNGANDDVVCLHKLWVYSMLAWHYTI